MAVTFLLLGTNLGDRLNYLKQAGQSIEEKAGKILQSSSIYETAAWGKVKQADYLNQILEIETSLTPKGLLQTTAKIEDLLGREREVVWGPRTIDIDILFYDQLVCDDPSLILPHPHIPKRRFVLTPLAEIAPDLYHPVLKTDISSLLMECRDPLWVEKYQPTPAP